MVCSPYQRAPLFPEIPPPRRRRVAARRHHLAKENTHIYTIFQDDTKPLLESSMHFSSSLFIIGYETREQLVRTNMPRRNRQIVKKSTNRTNKNINKTWTMHSEEKKNNLNNNFLEILTSGRKKMFNWIWVDVWKVKHEDLPISRRVS